MAGHNKWSKVKHRKAGVDAKRSKLWTKIIREVSVATRLGGPDPTGNPRLRKAIDDARAANVPKDTLERAIKRAAGGEEGADYEELVYEGYGPGGVALLIECTTDNRNRTSGDVRSVLHKHGGNLGTSGSVAFLFEKKGHFIFEKKPEDGKAPSEEALLEIGLEHGAEDVSDDGESFTVTCAPGDFQTLREAYQAAGFVPASAAIAQLPASTVKVSGADAAKLMKLIDLLEDLDDVQNVWANYDIEAEEMERLLAS